MKTRPNALQAVLDRQSAAAAEPAPASETRTAVPKRPSRVGKRLIGGHFPPGVAKQLRLIAAEEDTSVQALLEEALDLLFVKKGKGHLRLNDE